MSALRVSVPGYPTVLIPLGPSKGRIHGIGGSTLPRLGGTYVVAMAKITQTRMEAASRRTIPEETQRPICGAILRLIGEPCARRPGHRDHHRSVETMRNAAQRRRTGAA